jgi:hypothetical protein
VAIVPTGISYSHLGPGKSLRRRNILDLIPWHSRRSNRHEEVGTSAVIAKVSAEVLLNVSQRTEM